MNRLRITIVGLISLITSSAMAQEIACADGVDNDGDGFIDCFDGDCADLTICDDTYFGNNASCEVEPNEFPAFSLTLDFASPNETANHIGRMAVGDLDRDGIPEMIAQNKYTDRIFIMDGATGAVKSSTDLPGNATPEWRVAIGNVQDDNCGEVFAVGRFPGGGNDTDYRIYAFDCNLNLLWESERMERDPMHMGLADFDRDGQVELYYKNEIRDAATGTRIVNGSGDNWDNINGGPVAVDLDTTAANANLELVSGGTIYSVNLGNRSAGAGSLTVQATMPGGYSVKRKESSTSIADYNLDGFLDVIATGEDTGDTTTVFFWDVRNNTVRTFKDPIPFVSNSNLKCTSITPPNDAYSKGWRNGTGRLNIGDLDGDGLLNVAFVSGRFLYALDENFDLFWRVDVNEETSGYTGCTLFDFNGDGRTEVVYRDEQWLYIIDGTNGAVFTQTQCISRTSIDYPIVADVDADGSTEICVVCGTDDTNAWDNFCDLSYSSNSQVRVYRSNGEPWVPARRLWNQHGYFNVNVNDDLSIPVNMQKHHLVWSEGTCSVGPNRPLNNFLNQSPFLDSDGCPVYASPDLTFVDNSLNIQQPVCPERDFQVSFAVTNQGDATVSGDVPVSFYNGDPFQTGAIYLGSATLSTTDLAPGDTIAANNLTVTGPGSAFTLFIALNDDGSTLPTPVVLPNTNFLECDYNDNVVSGQVLPGSFPLTVETTDNIQCELNDITSNGSASAYRLVGGVEETADYIFSWFDSTVVSGTPDYQGAVYSGLAEGTYSVFATHITGLCNSDTVQFSIDNEERQVTVAVTPVNNTNCENPNGSLTAVVNGGDPVGNFTYEWYRQNQAGQAEFLLGTSHILTGLPAETYVVRITEKLTGCLTSTSAQVDPDLDIPIVVPSAVDIDCSGSDIGEVSAEVQGEGTSGYTFEWYIGNNVKPTSDFVGASQSNLAAGEYTVVATNTTTGCSSDPVTTRVNQTLPPTIDGIASTPMTSCDSSLPNGTATVTVSGTTDFRVEWYTGQNTSPANLISGETGLTINDLAIGTYTAKVIDNVTNCFATDDVAIISNIVIPQLTLSKTDVTACNDFNGVVTANVSPGNIADYTFEFYEGNAIKAMPDFSATGNNTWTQRGPGIYTVRAFNNLTNCSTNEASITLEEVAIILDINLTGSSVPLDCSSTSGSLSIALTPATANYQIDWFNGAVDPNTATPDFSQTGSTSTYSGLTSGNYTVRATNTDTNCEVIEVFNLPIFSGHNLVLNNTVAANNCNDNNGQIAVTLTTTNQPPYTQNDYTIEVYSGSAITGSPVQTLDGSTGGGTADPREFTYNFTGLSSGDYAVIAVRKDDDMPACEDPIVLATVNLEVEYPTVTATTLDANTNCMGTTANGTIAIEVNSGIDPLSNFTINWFEGTDTSTPLGPTNVAVLNNLSSGFYTVQVIDNTAFPACATIRTFQVIENPPVISIASADLVVTPLSRCDMVNGGAKVNAVSENGLAGNLADYTFQWYDADNNILPNPLIPNDSIGQLNPGTYFVRAENTMNSCLSTLVQFEVEDLTLNDPGIDLIAFQNPTICRQDDDGDNSDNDNLLGMLEIQANGTSTTGFTITWREDSDTGTIIGSTERIENLSFSTPTRQYYVQVRNNDTQCITSTTFELQLIDGPVFSSITATPVTSCATPDGTVFATVTSGGSDAYNYSWTSNGNSIGSGKGISGLNAGEYMVEIVDPNDPATCRTTETITIEMDQIFPDVMTEIVAPLSVCDPARANGVARASVNGEFIGYTFEWYEGTDVTGSPIFTGPEFSGLQAMTYSVVVTNVISECSTTAQVEIPDNAPEIPDPTVELLSNVTSCVSPNGALTASVDGNTSDYIFEWFDGQQVGNTPDFIGETYDSLDVGFYTVIATNRFTGCVSGPATGEVIEDINFPEFEFIIGSANCNQNNGFAQLLITNGVEVERIEWISFDGSVVVGPNLTEAAAGNYSVTVTSTLGCEVTEEFTIISEITPYNGVSRNGDGRNDIFLIECIEDFPENIVKIFNRAGTLVYEAEGYDNSSIFFDGVSNKGMRVMGTNLPDGTYFYVIDKRNGDKLLSGYLEVVN